MKESKRKRERIERERENGKEYKVEKKEKYEKR